MIYKLLTIFTGIIITIFIVAGTPAFADQYTAPQNEECDEKCLAEFHTPDYDKPFSKITFNKKSYTWGSQVRVIIYAPSWNADKDKIDTIGEDSRYPIRISTRGHSIEPYAFDELAPNSGQFFGKFKLTGFSHDGDGDGRSDLTPSTSGRGPYGGKLQCDRDDAVTVSFEAADGVVLVNSAPITWNMGQAQFNQKSYKPGDSATITVTDADMNLIHNALNTIKVQVYSDSDSGGTTITAVETDVNTGIFEGHITLTDKDESSGDRLFVLDGDTLFARYTDRTVPQPFSIEDQVDLLANSTYTSGIATSDRITQQNIRIADAHGNLLSSGNEGDQIFVLSNLVNNLDNQLQFAYLVQIKDENDNVLNLSWMTGAMVSKQSMDASQSWIPNHKGKYTIETFVWSSLANPTPLAKKQALEFTIS